MQLRHTQFSEKLDERRQAMIVEKTIMLLLAFSIAVIALGLSKLL
jgi:hypothetical protein